MSCKIIFGVQLLDKVELISWDDHYWGNVWQSNDNFAFMLSSL